MTIPFTKTPGRLRWLPALLLLAGGLTGCKPRTPTEKAQDKVEDAAHETKQGVDRAGKHMKEDLNAK